MADRIIRVRGGEIISNMEVENPLSVDEIEW